MAILVARNICLIVWRGHCLYTPRAKWKFLSWSTFTSALNFCVSIHKSIIEMLIFAYVASWSWGNNETVVKYHWRMCVKFTGGQTTAKKTLTMGLAFLSEYDIHDDVTTWKNFPHYWPFVGGIQWSPRASNVEHWCSLFCQPEQAIEPTV